MKVEPSKKIKLFLQPIKKYLNSTYSVPGPVGWGRWTDSDEQKSTVTALLTLVFLWEEQAFNSHIQTSTNSSTLHQIQTFFVLLCLGWQSFNKIFTVLPDDTGIVALRICRDLVQDSCGYQIRWMLKSLTWNAWCLRITYVHPLIYFKSSLDYL